ncbi:MAG: GTP-binding protein [Pirellulales bacterium]|nr:GTP-binding protein [Pirellulales bacterium]
MSGRTEFCLLTPPGRGAVAVIGVHGPRAGEIARSFFRPTVEHTNAKGEIPLRRILYGRWKDSQGEELVICRVGDACVEINCHGGVAAPAVICRDLRSAGCVEVTHAEWIARESGNDLIATEVWQALALAQTEKSAAILLAQRSGVLAREIASIVGLVSGGQTRNAQTRLDVLRRRAQLGQHLTEPWKIVLVGEPNVGKSSLINCLLGFERAIVHPQPGTTRDVVTSQAAFHGWLVELSDTAGQRTSDDALESTGMQRGRAAMQNADLIIHVRDAREYLPAGIPTDDILHVSPGQEVLLIANKCDLASNAVLPTDVLPTSAKSGVGISQLMSVCIERLIPDPPGAHDAVPFTRRQFELLEQAKQQLKEDRADAAVLSLAQVAHKRLPELPSGAAGW